MKSLPVLLLSFLAISTVARQASALTTFDRLPRTIEMQDSARSPKMDAVLEELISLERLLFSAQQNGDRATLERLLAEDFTWTDIVNHHKLNREKFLSQVKADDSIKDLECQDYKLKFDGPAAVLSGDCAYNIHGFLTTHVREHFTDRWIKKDGEWQIVSAETSMSNKR